MKNSVMMFKAWQILDNVSDAVKFQRANYTILCKKAAKRSVEEGPNSRDFVEKESLTYSLILLPLSFYSYKRRGFVCHHRQS